MKIIAVYDNGGRTIDRYTLITDATWQNTPPVHESLGLSEDVNDFSQWGSVNADELSYNASNRQWRSRTEFGKRIRFEDLPEKVQRHAAERIFNLREDA